MLWKRKVAGPVIGGKQDDIHMGGRDVPGHGWSPKKMVEEHTKSIRGIEGIKKFNPNHDEKGRFSSGDTPSVKDLFAHSLNITRGDMPQIPNDFKEKFISELREEGINVRREFVPARELLPTQKDYNEQNIDFVRRSFANGKLGLDSKDNPIVVSSDNRILDGHHRWAVLAQQNKPIYAVRVDLPIRKLLARAEAFNDENSIEHRTKEMVDKSELIELEQLVQKFNPNHEPAGTPEGGQFASASGDSQESKFRELKSKWAQINETLRPMMQNPDSPEVKQKLAQLKDISKQIYAMDPHVTDSPYDPLPEGSKARDLVIVGGGPAGLSAAINAGAEGLSTVLVDANPTPGGQARFSSRIENYPGFPIGATGQSLMTDMAEQASRFPATQLRSGVRATGMTVDPKTGLKTVTFSDGTSETAKAVILAGGLEFRKLSFDGADSKNVITGDGATLAEVSKDKPVVIYGGANSAAQAALGCSDASHVYLISRNPITKDMSDYQVEALRAQKDHITIIEGDEVKSFLPAKDGEYELSTKNGQHIEAAALGVFVGAAPKNDWLPSDIKIGTEGENRGKILHDENYETGIPGVFAVGQTASGGIGRVLASAGSGQIAVANLFKYFSRVKKADKKGQSAWNALVDRMYQIDISDVPKFEADTDKEHSLLGIQKSSAVNFKKSSAWLKKDPTVQAAPPTGPSLVGAGYKWHKTPTQVPLTEKRKSPRLIVGAYGVKPNATFPRAETVGKSNDNHDPKTGEFTSGSGGYSITRKTYMKPNSRGGHKNQIIYWIHGPSFPKGYAAESLKEAKEVMQDAINDDKNETKKADNAAGDEGTDSPDNNGRPRWMASPGQGGKDPQYRSQKPGPNGNNDELFSDNINDDPPSFKAVSPDDYYIWGTLLGVLSVTLIALRFTHVMVC